MNTTAAAKQNIYFNEFELRSREATDAGIYDFVVGNGVVPEPKQMAFEKLRAAEKGQPSAKASQSAQSDSELFQRLFFLVTVVVVASFLTAASTLVLALIMMMSQNTPVTACNPVRGKLISWRNH